MLAVIVTVKHLAENFILQNQLLTGRLENPKIRCQTKQVTIATKHFLGKGVHGTDVSIGQVS